MAKGVFITKVDPTYDDLPETQYHFPRTYLRQAEQMIGDWIVYYEPRRNGGRQVYFATARITRIDPDPKVPEHYYARMADYLEFPSAVPFRSGDTFPESGLRNPDGSVNLGLFQRAIHQLPDTEYLTMVQMGMAEGLLPQDDPLGQLLAAEPEADYGRKTVDRLVTRPLRDAAFQKVVRQAYDSTCAFTGIRLVNGGGRCEVEAAHIRPVEKAGPDSPRNGMALSRTVHWMFDRGVVSLQDDGHILIARKLVPEPMQRAFNPDGFARLPANHLLRPHPQFLRFHRETVFKG